jgi:rfaE bifunctional protein kinase chain/domain
MISSDRTLIVEAIAAAEAFQAKRVLVVGDIMLDRYVWGSIERISPEAPVPIVRRRGEWAIPGGAANVAMNVASLGGTPLLLGVYGADDAGTALVDAISNAQIQVGALVRVPNRPTTVKTRVVVEGKQVLRIDHESTAEIECETAAAVATALLAMVPAVDVVVVSDYAKGLLVPLVLRTAIETARTAGIPILIDPKGMDYLRYRGCTIITPNQVEAGTATGLAVDTQEDVERAGHALLDRLEADAAIITQGANGLTLFEPGRCPLHVPARAQASVDVTGAGDTVLAALSLAIAAQAGPETAARIANVAASLAVARVGTVAISRHSLCSALHTMAGGMLRSGEAL